MESMINSRVLYEPIQMWTSYWAKANKLFWSSSEVVARRGQLFSESQQKLPFDGNFDRMASEKGTAGVDAWMAMAAAMARIGPVWGLRLWTDVLSVKSPDTIIQRAAIENTRNGLRVIKAGMRPVQKQVSANSKRLAKKRTHK
jgi:hypothetical protein